VYAIKFTGDGVRDLKSLPKNARNRLKKEVQSKLAKDPSACSDELRSPLQDWRSFHSGKYRVIFKLYSQPKVMVIAGIGEHSRRPERDIYRRLEVLVKQGKLAEKILATLRGL
jgi:mRNA-degrading endonuclease RelE of RelBE toxin-antitoxin system